MMSKEGVADMTDDELRALATRIVKRNQSYFWAPERQGERTKITRAFNILKDAERLGYKITLIEGETP